MIGTEIELVATLAGRMRVKYSRRWSGTPILFYVLAVGENHRDQLSRARYSLKASILAFLLLTLPAAAQSYSNNFALTENPISEGGNWVGGQSAGNNLWGDVRTTPGFAFGVSQPTGFGDPTALLTGTWGSDQTVTGVVRVAVPQSGCCEEIELRARDTINSTTHRITGYEGYCSVASNAPYCRIARWNGGQGDYCNLSNQLTSSSTPYAANGDTLKLTVTGTNPVTVTLYRNENAVVQASDDGSACSTGTAAGPWATGNPGIGFYSCAGCTNWAGWGFSSFSANSTNSPAPPTNVRATVK
jgi:hypothetical protein